MTKKTLEIIVPAFDPPVGWSLRMVEKWSEFEKKALDSGFSAVFLTVVDDGSSVGFDAAQIELFKKSFPEGRLLSHPKNRGKGFALRQGAAASEADILLVTDVDWPYEVASMAEMAKDALRSGGVAVGHRTVDYYAQAPFFRSALSKAFRWTLRNALRLPVSDTQCGLKAFDRQGRDVFLKTETDRFLFDLEFLVLASKTPGLDVRPIDVKLRPDVRFSRVGWRILAQESLNFLKILMKKQ